MALDSPNDMYDNEGPNREITLGTSTILGIFFALALVCALFFGFGYSVGRKSVPTASEDASTGSSTSKPSAGSPAIQPDPGYLSSKDAAAANQAPTDQVYAPLVASSTTAATGKPSAASPAPATALPAQTTPAQPVNQTQPVKSAPETATVQLPSTPSQPAAASPAMVQIAAVSHQEDADLLLSALRSHGYAVFVRQEQDKLLHVQIGPFATRKEADAMRQRLLADGYNAIVK